MSKYYLKITHQFIFFIFLTDFSVPRQSNGQHFDNKVDKFSIYIFENSKIFLKEITTISFNSHLQIYMQI